MKQGFRSNNMNPELSNCHICTIQSYVQYHCVVTLTTLRTEDTPHLTVSHKESRSCTQLCVTLSYQLSFV